MLSVLHPHILQAYENAQAVTRMQHGIAAYFSSLEAANSAIVCLSPQLTIRWMTPSAERVLSAYGLMSRRQMDRLHRYLIEWIRAQEAVLSSPDEALCPPRPYAVSGATGRLTIRILRQRAFRLLLLEEVPSLVTWTALAALCLSPRETDILSWIAQGKTNPEIGIILGISRRTVHKHLEHIYLKLGVENRTAAAAVATEAVRTFRAGMSSEKPTPPDVAAAF